MVYSTGCKQIDNQIMLDGRLLNGLPSGHIVTIVENPEEQRDFPKHFLSRIAFNTQETVWWIDLVNQFVKGSTSNIILTCWHNDDWEKFHRLFVDVFKTIHPSIVVVDNAFAIHEIAYVSKILEEFQRLCAVGDCLGFFLSYETKPGYWYGDFGIRNFSSYVIDWDKKKIVYSKVMRIPK